MTLTAVAQPQPVPCVCGPQIDPHEHPILVNSFLIGGLTLCALTIGYWVVWRRDRRRVAYLMLAPTSAITTPGVVWVLATSTDHSLPFCIVVPVGCLTAGSLLGAYLGAAANRYVPYDGSPLFSTTTTSPVRSTHEKE